MTLEVQEAIEALKQAYGEENIEVKPEVQGGAYIIVKNIPIGDKFIPTDIWCGFLINYTYPESDVYPHFVNEDLKKNNESPEDLGKNATERLGAGYAGPVDWNDRKAIQISRRSNRWSPAQDTALIKLTKVINWMQN